MAKMVLQPLEMVKLENFFLKKAFSSHVRHDKSKKIDKMVVFSTTEKMIWMRKVIIFC